MKKFLVSGAFLMVILAWGCKDGIKSGSTDLGENENPEAEPSFMITPQCSAFGDPLVATDALGRELPSYEDVGPEKSNHYVGLFYWLWHGDLRNESSIDYNVTQSNLVNPERTEWQFADYYWAEPELGYYRSTDEYVLQKHLNQFCLLGIDFLYLDFTNSVLHDKELHLLLHLIKEMKSKGYTPPTLVPFFNAEPLRDIEKFYNEFYLNKEYNNCWFIYEGKPLILSPIKHPTNKVLNNSFTWRKMWAAFPKTDEYKSQWRFFDTYPLSPAYFNGKVEQAVVAKGVGAPIWDNHIYGGSSSTSKFAPQYDKYWKCKETGTGLFFEEQWKEAHRIQPLILCITGWNEWKAGAWHADKGLVNAKFKFRNKLLKEGDFYFVDEFNEEFNRDIEPQSGSYTDNFYYQLASHLRRYKGMKKPVNASPSRVIKIDGKFTEWKEVYPIFEDFKGELKNRNSKGAPKGTHYVNYTKRNDIVESRVTWDKNNTYFYVKAAEAITSWKDKNWMMLYIDVDKNKETGWEGYDFVVNMEVNSSHKTTLKQWDSGKWKTVTVCPFEVVGCEMEIAVPLEMLGLTEKPAFYFHWVDNIQKLDDINEFFINGESAPERRYNYYYKGL